MQRQRRAVIVVLHTGDQPIGLESLHQKFEIRYTEIGGLADAIVDAEILLLWDFFSAALREVWDLTRRLKWIHVPAAGVDKLLFPKLIASNVIITNAQGVFDRPMAEFALANVLGHAKKMQVGYEFQAKREWFRRETTSILGKSALILGTGAVGRETARLLTAVGMTVQGAGRRAREGDRDFGSIISSEGLATHVGGVDYLIVASPLTTKTFGIIDKKVLLHMKPTSYIINIGRGECIVQQDLIKTLEEGLISGAALDVFQSEPLDPMNALWATPGVTISAHIAGDAREYSAQLTHQFLDNLDRYIEGRELINVVDKRLGFISTTNES